MDDRRYSNREIVAEYLHHKLAQRGYEWRIDEWGSSEEAGGNGASPGLPDGAATPTDAAEPSDAVGQGTLPALLPDAPPDIHCTLRWATDEFSRRYCRDYGHLSEQLLCPSPPGTARTRFTMVIEELFSNGINWGRIVAFFEFGAALCIESVHREMAPQLVDSLAAWMTEYLDQHLQRWILDNGGWDAFVELYGNRRAPVFSFSWLSTKMFFGLAVLGACITLGAYLGHK